MIISSLTLSVLMLSTLHYIMFFLIFMKKRKFTVRSTNKPRTFASKLVFFLGGAEVYNFLLLPVLLIILTEILHRNWSSSWTV